MNKNVALVSIYILILTACKSDFDNCFEQELPRAEVAAELEEAREAGRQLVAIKELGEKIIGFEKEIDYWLNSTVSV